MHTLELGSLAAFERRGLEPVVLNLPLPAEEPADVLSSGATYRLFDYRDGASAIVFVLMGVLLVGLPLCGALLAGFTVARDRAAATPVLAAAWGALVGPVWAIALALVKPPPGHALRPCPGRDVFGSCSSSARSSARSGATSRPAEPVPAESGTDAAAGPATPLARPQAPDAEPDEASQREAEHDRQPELAAAARVAVTAAAEARRLLLRLGGLRRARPSRSPSLPGDLARHLEVDRGVELLRPRRCCRHRQAASDT